MRDDSTRLLPRISTTVSVGTSTSVISLESSVSRMRALRLSRTFFSCPEYVCRMNHCCMTYTFLRHPEEAVNLIEQERENPVHDEEVGGEEDDGDDRDDRRVPDLQGRGPRRPAQLRAHVAQEPAGAREEAVARAARIARAAAR